MYSRPSASHRRLPLPRTMKRGVPPTARNARTGELTPPGMTFRERSNSSSFFEVMAVEHPGEFPRAILYVRRVEQGADHGDGIGSRVDQGPRVFDGDAPDRDYRAGQAELRFPVEREGRTRSVGLGCRDKGAAEGDVIGSGGTRIRSEIEPVVAGRPQDLARPQADSRRGDGQVLAAEVQAVGAQGLGQLEVVVDDERNAHVAADREQGRALLAAQRSVRGFVSVLDQARTACESKAHFAHQRGGARLVQYRN